MDARGWSVRWVTSVGRLMGYHPEEFRLATLEPESVPDSVWQEVAQDWMSGWTAVGCCVGVIPMAIGFPLTLALKSDGPFEAGYALTFMIFGFSWFASTLTWCRRARWRLHPKRPHPALFRRTDPLFQVTCGLLLALVVVSGTT
jgi:hypothetical protein